MHSFVARLVSSPADVRAGAPASQPVRIAIDRGRIASLMPVDLSPTELDDLPYVAPGMFDLQVNGYRGIWFSSETLTVDDVERVILDYVAHGVTRCLPTLITNSLAALEHGLRTIRAARDRHESVRQIVAGCHLEGPFISPVDGPRGAHAQEHVRPAAVAEVQRWQQASGGLVRLITLAPEVDGAEELITDCVGRGIRIAIGHTAAHSATIRRAIDLGACLGTHLGNGCASSVPRHDNPFWVQLADDRIACSVIADGWHVPHELLTVAVRSKSAERLVLTSDVSGFAGCATGRHASGAASVDVLHDGRIVVAGQTQFLAGSGVLTGDCVAQAVNTGLLDLPHAWSCASTVPAALLGLSPALIREGGPATMTVFRLVRPTTVTGPSDVAATALRYRPISTFVAGVHFRGAPNIRA